MTFDPETLYAKPAPTSGVRPVVFVLGGVALVGTVLGIVTKPYWWPAAEPASQQHQEIKSHNSANKTPPLNFAERYTPAVYAPPPPAKEEPPSDTSSRPVVQHGPATPSTPSGPAKKPGIPEDERRSSVVLDGGQTGALAAAAGASGTAPTQQAMQQIAARGERESFYSAAGQQREMFRPTGIVGQLGRCTVRPGTYLFHEAVGVISSDTPGQVTAKTSRPIYAGPKGDCYAAPAGSALVGTFNANTAYGQERIQVAWTGLFLPNGRMIDLGGMPGAGADGAAGLPSDVNNHYGALAAAVLAGTAVDVIRGLATFGGGQGDVVINMGGALADRTASIGERLVDRELNRQPTLTAKQEELAVQVTRPIVLDPYQE